MNTEYARSLYKDLMALSSEPDSPFYYVDHSNEYGHFRVFNYRLASYTDFLKPSALDCRGTMFHVSKEGDFVALAALTPRKFFNWKENPMTMDLDLSKVQYIMDKVDGSLMTTYYPRYGDLEAGFVGMRLKSKTSLTSEQANAANAYLMRPENKELRWYLDHMYMSGFSVSLEWTSPEHRIVVGYQEERLTVLEARSLFTGEEVSYNDLCIIMEYMGCVDHLVKITEFNNAEEFINSIASMKGNIEGFVIRMEDGQKMKIKTDDYSALHHCKDSVTIPRRLYEVVVQEAHDDLRAMFSTDQYVLGRIDEYEALVKNLYAKIDDGPVRFFNENRELSRKDYAIKGQAELPRLFFSLAMNLYLGKTNDYKEFLIKHYDDFKVTDQESFESEENGPTKTVFIDIESYSAPSGMRIVELRD
jgi:T4 RnlA family RNA ligase